MGVSIRTMIYCKIKYVAQVLSGFTRQFIPSCSNMGFRDNNDHTELLQQFKMSEDSMKEQVLSRIISAEDVGAPDMTTIETFTVKTTGASISTLGSVSLLHHYCTRLAHDRYSNRSLL